MKKTKSKSNKKKMVTESDLLKSDLLKISVPFDLYSGLSLVTEELNSKGYSYKGLSENGEYPILTFIPKDVLKEDESILINIEKENLLVRHFDVNPTGRKLRVIYVVKPTERSFNLI